MADFGHQNRLGLICSQIKMICPKRSVYSITWATSYVFPTIFDPSSENIKFNNPSYIRLFKKGPGSLWYSRPYLVRSCSVISFLFQEYFLQVAINRLCEIVGERHFLYLKSQLHRICRYVHILTVQQPRELRTLRISTIVKSW